MPKNIVEEKCDVDQNYVCTGRDGIFELDACGMSGQHRRRPVAILSSRLDRLKRRKLGPQQALTGHIMQAAQLP